MLTIALVIVILALRPLALGDPPALCSLALE